MKRLNQNPYYFREVIETLEDGKEVNFKVNGLTMLPFYKHDETIVTVKQMPVAIGDVILYKDRRLKLHRIIGQTGQQFITQGDGQYQNTFLISIDAVIGKVIAYEHQQRRIDVSDPRHKRSVRLWLKVKNMPMSKLYIKYLRRQHKAKRRSTLQESSYSFDNKTHSAGE